MCVCVCVFVEGRKIKIRKNDRDNEDSIESGVLGNIASVYFNEASFSR